MALDPPPEQPSTWTFLRVMWATLVLVLLALCFWLLYRFHQVVFTLFVAIVLGTIIRPSVTWLYRRGLPRMAAALLVYFLIFALLVGFMFVLFPLIIEQGAMIVAAMPGSYQTLREWLVLAPNQLVMRLGQFLPATLPSLAPTQPTGQEVLATAGQALRYVALGGRGIFAAAALLLLAFHWTLDGPRTIQSWLLLAPKDDRDSLGELIATMETKVGAYIAGQGVLCLVIGLMALVAYLLIGLPNALVLALLAGAMEAVPMVGPLLGALPAAVIALSIAPAKLIWVIAASLVIQQTEAALLVPRVMRRAVGVNPFVSLLALFAFGSFFGIAGALIAIPIAAMVQLLLNRFVFQPEATEAEGLIGRDHSSRLRYEAQALVQDLRKQARLDKAGSDERVGQIDQVMDEIEAITTDLDALLSQSRTSGAP